MLYSDLNKIPLNLVQLYIVSSRRRMLFAESLPSWFTVPYHNRTGLPRLWLVSPGFSGNLLLLSWSLMGGFLVFFCLSLWRQAGLLPPMYEDAIDTAAEILKREIIPFLNSQGGFWIDFLRQSDNPVYQQLAEITINPEDDYEISKLIKEMHEEGTLVYLNNAIWSDLAKLGDYHFGKEVLEGDSPYTYFLLNKLWPLNEQLARHIVRYQQVRTV